MLNRISRRRRLSRTIPSYDEANLDCFSGKAMTILLTLVGAVVLSRAVPVTMHDVLIIGGSFAGLFAALQLGRACRKVTVLDTGLPLHRFAGHSHGLPGHDHKPPLDILAEAQQPVRYPAISLVSARADSISAPSTISPASLGGCACRWARSRASSRRLRRPIPKRPAHSCSATGLAGERSVMIDGAAWIVTARNTASRFQQSANCLLYF